MGLFEQIKDAVSIKDIVERYGEKLNRNNKIHCPFHGQDKTPSLSVDPKNNMFKCFACSVAGDAIRFAARLKNIEDYEAAKLIIDDFRLNIDYETEFSKSPQGKIRAYIKECQGNISATDYFQKRGLTAETIRNFGLGYDLHNKAVVIPYSSNLTYYQRRSVVDKRFYKPKTEDAGAEPIWNLNALKSQSKTPIFVVESPICAMGIAQYGGVSVALCGSGINKLIEAIKHYKPNYSLILALDNDEQGKTTTINLQKELKALKIKHIVFNVAGQEKDPNELLMKSANRLVKNIEEATKEALLAGRERKDLISLQELCNMGVRPTKYLVENMLPENALSLLVAASKVGKSWWVLQLAIAMVQGDNFLDKKTTACSVLYYALEDSDPRMVQRKNKLTGGKEIPKNLYIKLETKTIETGLLEEMQHHIKTIPNLKLIIIDTFQLVRGLAQRNEGAYAWDYREMSVLRKFCADNKVALLLVHHARKQGDDGDIFNMISGSMGIMGAADATLFISKKKRMDDNEPYKMSQTGRDVQQVERIIERNVETGQWYKVGNAEEQQAKREQENFNNSKVVQLVLQLIARQPNGWSGTTKDFVKEGISLFNTHIGSEAEVGREIKKIEYELLRQHKINHEVKRASSGNKHIFRPHNPYSLFNYAKNKEQNDD